MHLAPLRSLRFSGPRDWRSVAAAIFSLVIVFTSLPSQAEARPPRAERVANRIAERRYARLSIAEARTTRAEARVAEIAPAVPVPPPPRPATVRRMARAGVPLGGPTPPAAVVATPQQTAPASASVPATPPAPRPLASTAPPARPATPPAPAEPGAWTLAPDDAVAPAAAEVAPDGTRSVLSAGGVTPGKSAAPADRPGPAVTQPAVELLPTPEAK